MKKGSPRKALNYHHRQKSDGMIPPKENEELLENGTIKKTSQKTFIKDNIINTKYDECMVILNEKMKTMLSQLNKYDITNKTQNSISLSSLKMENKKLNKENEMLLEQYRELKENYKEVNDNSNVISNRQLKKIKEENKVLQRENDMLMERIRKLKKYKKNKLLGSTMKYRMEFLLQIMTGSMKELVYLFENEGKENTNENIVENISDSDKVSISDDSDSSIEVNTTNNYVKKETEFVNQSERMNKKIKRTTNTDDVEDRKKNYYNNSAINYNKSNQYNF